MFFSSPHHYKISVSALIVIFLWLFWVLTTFLHCECCNQEDNEIPCFMEVQRFLCLALVPSTSAREVWGYSEHTIRRQKELFHTRGILDLEGECCLEPFSPEWECSSLDTSTKAESRTDCASLPNEWDAQKGLQRVSVSQLSLCTPVKTCPLQTCWNTSNHCNPKPFHVSTTMALLSFSLFMFSFQSHQLEHSIEGWYTCNQPHLHLGGTTHSLGVTVTQAENNFHLNLVINLPYKRHSLICCWFGFFCCWVQFWLPLC